MLACESASIPVRCRMAALQHLRRVAVTAFVNCASPVVRLHSNGQNFGWDRMVANGVWAIHLGAFVRANRVLALRSLLLLDNPCCCTPPRLLRCGSPSPVRTAPLSLPSGSDGDTADGAAVSFWLRRTSCSSVACVAQLSCVGCAEQGTCAMFVNATRGVPYVNEVQDSTLTMFRRVRASFALWLASRWHSAAFRLCIAGVFDFGLSFALALRALVDTVRRPFPVSVRVAPSRLLNSSRVVHLARLDQVADSQGPIVEGPVHGVIYFLVDITLNSDSIHRGAGSFLLFPVRLASLAAIPSASVLANLQLACPSCSLDLSLACSLPRNVCPFLSSFARSVQICRPDHAASATRSLRFM